MRARLAPRWRIGKWMVTLLTLVSLLIWLPNSATSLRYVWGASRGGGPSVRIGNGAIVYDSYINMGPALDPKQNECLPAAPMGWSIGEPVGATRGWLWTKALAGERTCYASARIPLTLCGILAALLWWRDRRPSRGHCPTCGYDLTGNVSGMCSECGAKV